MIVFVQERGLLLPACGKEEEEEDGGEASALTVTAMGLKGSINAARVYRQDRGGRTKKSTIITGGRGELKETDDLKTQNKSGRQPRGKNHL